MNDIVELNLSRAINYSDTTFVRAALQRRMENDGLDCHPVELVRFHVFIHCTSGSGTHMVDFEDHLMEPGVAIWVRPGQVQRWSDVDDYKADVVVFESPTIPDLPLFDRFVAGTTVAQLGADADRMRQQMDWLAADLDATQDQAMAAAVVGVILRLFARHAASGAKADSATRRLTDAFLESVDSNVGQRSVAWHAKQIGASTRSVARATAETLRRSPKEIVDARVILEAQRRLAWSGEDISTIARTLRFSEASNFTKFFRTRTGMAPSSFRDVVSSMWPTAGEPPSPLPPSG